MRTYKEYLKTFLSLFTLLVFSACSGQKPVTDNSYGVMLDGLLEHNVKEISVAELSKDTSNIVFIDTREKAEYDVSHLKNAIWVGYDEQTLDDIKKLPKSTKIVAYCSVGFRSEKTTQKLDDLGYLNVTNLYGGLFEWVNQDLPIYKAQSTKTTQVHAYNYIWGKWLNKGIKVYN